MDKISLWCKSVAVISVFSSVLNLILPGSKVKNSFKTLTAIVLIYSMLIPMIQGTSDIESIYSITDERQESAVYESYEYFAVLEAAEIAADSKIADIMAELNIAGECETECRYISDEKVSYTVTVKAEVTDEMRTKLENNIKSVLGSDTTVYFAEEERNE